MEMTDLNHDLNSSSEAPECEKPAFVSGTRFKFAGLEWVALDEVEGGVLAVTSECLKTEYGTTESYYFDEGCSNDWRKSALRRYLNSIFLLEIGFENLIKQTLDLTADDGMKDYGTSEDYIGILSCDQYRKYRYILPKYVCAWWTLTPWTCLSSFSHYVQIANPSGYVSPNRAWIEDGVAPTCIFKSEIYNSLRKGGEKRL